MSSSSVAANETIFEVSNSSNVISTSHHHLIFNRGGNYGCQGDCKRYIKMFLESGLSRPMAYHIQTVLRQKKADKQEIQRLLALGFLYCSACSHVFDPLICRGKKRKFCPCCSDRLKLLKTALNQSTATKIRNVAMVPRVE